MDPVVVSPPFIPTIISSKLVPCKSDTRFSATTIAWCILYGDHVHIEEFQAHPCPRILPDIYCTFERFRLQQMILCLKNMFLSSDTLQKIHQWALYSHYQCVPPRPIIPHRSCYPHLVAYPYADHISQQNHNMLTVQRPRRPATRTNFNKSDLRPI